LALDLSWLDYAELYAFELSAFFFVFALFSTVDYGVRLSCVRALKPCGVDSLVLIHASRLVLRVLSDGALRLHRWPLRESRIDGYR